MNEQDRELHRVYYEAVKRQDAGKIHIPLEGEILAGPPVVLWVNPINEEKENAV